MLLAMRLACARVLAALSALGWLVFPGFGLIDLSVTWSTAWPELLEAGWGLFTTVLVAAAFVLVVLHPRESRAGIAQLALADVCLAVAAVAAAEWRLIVLVVLLTAETVVVGGLVQPWWLPARRGRSAPLLVLAAVGVVPWLVYAVHMWQANGNGGEGGDRTLGIDHYSMQGALGSALAVLPLVAALRGELRPFTPICAGVAAAYLGLVSLRWQGAVAGFGRVWSALAIAWGIAVLTVSLPAVWPRRKEPG